MTDKTATMRNRELERGRRIEDVLRDQVEAGKSWEAIADDLNVSRVTLQTWRKTLRLRVVTKRTLVRDGAEGSPP